MIIWDEQKNQKLIRERNVSFEEVADKILWGEYIAILKHPARENQQLFVIALHGYIHVVPSVIDEKDNIVLKTVFPSRKLHKIYGGKE